LIVNVIVGAIRNLIKRIFWVRNYELSHNEIPISISISIQCISNKLMYLMS